ncbi:hypothetical protein O181_109261 [Austropuccinia psidii MF-1]|uniref:Uncharacterized protein n=1 Tax=Austropuccinia psidii MF-1 TaxID=1389203 RepID=A0A9Q3JWY3_9BASI|nr:hypothetical protein [Austropuccinia psidii MF-1]
MIKEYHAKKKEATKEEAPVASTSKPQANPLPKKGRRTRKRTGENHIPQVTRFQKSKRCHGKRLQHGQNLDGIQRQRGEKNETIPMRQPHFPRK